MAPMAISGKVTDVKNPVNPVPPHGALVIVGSGPGIGSHTAAIFAQNGFRRVVLLSRNETRLKDDAAIVRVAAPRVLVDTVSVDLTDTLRVEGALEEVDRRLEGAPLECVVFNAARSENTEMVDLPVEGFERDLKLSVVSLYAVIRWAIPQLLQLGIKDEYKPALLVTSSTLCENPLPQLFSQSSCKAAQNNLITSCYKKYSSQNVHCGMIVLQPEMNDNALLCDARAVAAKAWEFYSQEKGKGDLSIHV